MDLWKKENEDKENLNMDDCPYLCSEVTRQPILRAPEILSNTKSEDPVSDSTGIKIK